MESLPDDILHKILQIGIQAGRLDHVDLCSLAIVNNHFDQLTKDPALWDTLLSHDFPLSFYPFEAPLKGLYRWMYQLQREYQCQTKPFGSGITINNFSEGLNAIDNRRAGLVTFFDGLGITIGEEDQLAVLSLDEEWDSILPDASQPSLKKAHNRYYESKQRKRYGLIMDLCDVTIGGDLGVFLFNKDWDTILFDASQPSLKQAHNHYYESKPRKRYDKSSRPKVNPNSKSYIPMNRSPRRSMPRKI